MDYFMSDKAIVKQLGRYLKQMRLNSDMSQLQLAERSGLSRATVSNLENGRGGTMESFVVYLRHVQQLDTLDVFRQESIVSPMAMQRLLSKQRKRVKKNLNPVPNKHLNAESEW